MDVMTLQPVGRACETGCCVVIVDDDFSLAGIFQTPRPMYQVLWDYDADEEEPGSDGARWPYPRRCYDLGEE